MKKNNKINRYVGVTPFKTEQKDLFFGRAADTEKLFNLVNTEQQVLLYGKSGLGKSSLINAGLLPLLATHQALKIITIRFTAYQNENSISPIAKVLSYFPQAAPSLLDKIIDQENSLWYRCKAWTLETPPQPLPKREGQFRTPLPEGVGQGWGCQFLLIFDQFEELFTYPEEQLFTFKKQMADLLYSNIPQSFRKVLQKKQKDQPDLLSETELLLLNQPLQVKTLMSIREDRYSEMNKLADYLPDALHHRYSLAPLDREQATAAIITPARQAGEQFETAPFEYTAPALQKILDFLTKNNTKSIETTQLQILCNRLEKLQLPTIAEQNIPDFDDIFLDFYKESIDQLPENERLSTKQFIENELIKNDRRMSLDSAFFTGKVTENALNQLVKVQHLLRAEPNTTGGTNYELSHDTLISPITKAKNQREDEETKLRQIQELKQAKEKAEKDRKEKEKTQRQLRTVRGLLVVAVVAIVVAVYFAYDARRQRDRAERQERKIQMALGEMEKQKDKAEKALQLVLETQNKNAILEVARHIGEARKRINAKAYWEVASLHLDSASWLDSSATTKYSINELRKQIKK